MPGNTGTGSNRWLLFLAIGLAFIFGFKTISTGFGSIIQLILSNHGIFQPAATVEAPSQPISVPAATQAPAVVEVTQRVEPTLAPVYEPITLTIWHNWSEADLPAVQTALTGYTANHPNITFDLQYMTDMVNALPVAIASGSGPDIVGWWSSSVGRLAPDALLPLDGQGLDLVNLQSDFMPGAWKTTQYKGQTWGLPLNMMGMGLVFNTDLLGVDYTIPNSLDILLDYARSYEAANPGKKFFCNPGFSSKDAYYLAPIIFSQGSLPGYVDADGNVYVNRDEMIWGAERLPELAKYSLPDATYDACMSAFLNGEIPTWWTGPWSIPNIEGRGIHFGVAAMGRPFVETYLLMLPRSAEFQNHAAAALDVMLYLSSADIQADLVFKNRMVPASYRALANPLVSQMKGIYDFTWALDQGVPLLSTPFTDQQWGPVSQAIISILDGSQTARDALNAAQQTIEDNIANIR